MATGAASRFTGEEGARRLTVAFADQSMVGGDRALAAALARASKVRTYRARATIIEQGGDDSDFYLILVGKVQVETNGRAGPVRRAGDHFGELALIDVRERRSATVRALEETVVAKVSEKDFAAIAADHPSLWRCLAVEIARRLRQRLEDVPPKNTKPFVFIGSSREALPIAEAIAKGIADEHTEVRLWSEGVFQASETAIESLEGTVRTSDIAVLVLSPDDKSRSRGRTFPAPRDNVVFELGLFMGALGRGRTFVVAPRKGVKIPSDLLGVTPLTYEDGMPNAIAMRIAPICAELQRAITRLGPK